MSETTFAANGKMRWDFLHQAGAYLGDREFLRLQCKIFESEDLIDALYRIFIALIAKKGWLTRTGKIDDIGLAYLNGFYLPCAERIVLSGQVDTTNDELPDYAGLVTFGTNPDFTSVRRAILPRGVAAPFGAAPYAVTGFFETEASRSNLRQAHGCDLSFYTRYVAIMPDGRCVPCREMYYPDVGSSSTVSSVSALVCQIAAATINAWADSRYLWMVETAERLVGNSHETPLQLGVEEEPVLCSAVPSDRERQEEADPSLGPLASTSHTRRDRH